MKEASGLIWSKEGSDWLGSDGTWKEVGGFSCIDTTVSQLDEARKESGVTGDLGYVGNWFQCFDLFWLPKAVLPARPEGSCPQLASTDNEELPYTQARERERRWRITMMGKQKNET